MIDRDGTLKFSSRLLIEDLEISYSTKPVFRCTHLDLEGNVVAIIGHNGAGKSTLIKAILNLVPHARGLLQLSSVSGVLTPERDMAFCPEEGSVFADISVESYVKLWCGFKHRDTKYYKKEGARIIEELAIAPLFSRLGRELSKGQRRRVQTAIGYLLAPKLFLFDEPFDGLDVKRTAELTELIRRHSSETSCVISSHRMDVVERIADQVIVLKEGKIIEHGPVQDVCTALGSRTFAIEHARHREQLVRALRDRLPEALIGKIGDTLTITGYGIEEHTLGSIARQIDSNGFQISTRRPSLVDAMGYHLKSLG